MTDSDQKIHLDFTTELDILRKIAKKYVVLKEWYILLLDNTDGTSLLTEKELGKKLDRELERAIK